MIEGLILFITTLFSTPLLAYLTIGLIVVLFNMWIDEIAIENIFSLSFIIGVIFWPILVVGLIIRFFEVRQMRKEKSLATNNRLDGGEQDD